MLHSKRFVKKTRKGGILTTVREHYLRDDIACKSESCLTCDGGAAGADQSVLALHGTQPGTFVDADAGQAAGAAQRGHYIVIDTNVVLHQIDVLEHPALTNVIVPQTVLNETKHRNAAAHKRLRQLTLDHKKRFVVFSNEHHKDTFCSPQANESPNDCNDRAIRRVAKFYAEHLRSSTVRIMLLTDDRENATRCRDDCPDVLALTTAEYAARRGDDAPEMIDLVAESDTTATEALPGSVDNLFPEYLSTSEVEAGLSGGSLLCGKLHRSSNNLHEATVVGPRIPVSVGTALLIVGALHMNRAVDRDSVVVRLLPRDQWRAPSSRVTRDKVAVALPSNTSPTDNGDDSVVDDDDDDDDASSTITTTTTAADDSLILPTGRIVAILKRGWRPYSGALLPTDRTGSQRRLFQPADKLVPRIRIRTRQGASLEGQGIVVVIDGWARNDRFPHGHFVRRLGALGEKTTDNEMLLVEHDVPAYPFSERVLACLPQQLPWKISPRDLEGRRDLRSDTVVCSVDPPGCTDIDDALHARRMPDGNIEIGVHIADVTHFVAPGTPLDDEAQNRCTTVYLTDRRIDMLPSLLGTNLCSLRGGEDRLAVSVCWRITPPPECRVISVDCFKSAICSRAALTYEQAQTLVDTGACGAATIAEGAANAVVDSLRLLLSVARVLRERRIAAGALALASSEVRFEMGEGEDSSPVGIEAKVIRDTNFMVEEFMLLANATVAERTVQAFADRSMLRRHPVPAPGALEPLVRTAASVGIDIDTTSNLTLARSLDAAPMGHGHLLRTLATRCMQQAVYVCSGMEARAAWHHYGLAMPIYTHFTSPIRRYADVVVHRLLALACRMPTINHNGSRAIDTPLPEKPILHELAEQINRRHKMAQYAGRASVALHSLLFFRGRSVDEDAFVMQCRQNALVVLVPRYGLEGFIWLAQTPAEEARVEFAGESVTVASVTVRVFDRVRVRLSVDESGVLLRRKMQYQLLSPVIPGVSLEQESSGKKRPASEDVVEEAGLVEVKKTPESKKKRKRAKK